MVGTRAGEVRLLCSGLQIQYRDMEGYRHEKWHDPPKAHKNEDQEIKNIVSGPS